MIIDNYEEVKMKEIDCRGMGCPQPVVMAKQALEALGEEELALIVYNPS